MKRFSKKTFQFFVAILFGILTYIDVYSQSPAKYWISFKDKNGTPFSLTNPYAFLSERSIERRKKAKLYINSQDLPVSLAYCQQIESYGLKLIHTSRWFNGALFSVSDENSISNIQKLPFVSSVEKRSDAISLAKSSILKEIQTKKSTRIDSVLLSTYQKGYSPLNMLKLFGLHDKGFRGKGIIVAIIDAGFTSYDTLSVFDSLRANKQILGYRDFEKSGNTDFAKSTHGTVVLGTMAANAPNYYIGGAPDASYWLLRSENSETEYPSEEDNWVAAIEFADSAGVDIVNTSLGYFDFDNSNYNHTYKDLDGTTLRISIAASMAAQRGILLTISAGNSGDKKNPYIGAPADANDILTVGSVNQDGIRSTFSSVGPTFDKRIKPNIVAQGEKIASFSASGWEQITRGTSFSSPIVASATTCLLQAFPNNSIYEIIDAICKTASNAASPDSLIGNGIPNFELAYQYLLQNKKNDKNTIRAYPTIIDNSLTIELPVESSQIVSIECYNIDGRMVFETSRVRETSIILKSEIQNLADGYYIIHCTSDNLRSFIKVIKRRVP